MSLDPVTLALVQNRLDFISRHMGRVMSRTARSPIFSQAHDFSCFLTDAAGILISNADGIPIHTGGGGFAVRALLAEHGEEIAEGDVFVLNDPYVAGGNHLPDWVVARPVLFGGETVAFACNRAHQSDIGGGAAGTYNPEAIEIFHEGLRIPPVKLISRGRRCGDLWRLLLLNSRTPELLDGDLRAMVGSTRIGAERVAGLFSELGPEQGRAAFAAILEHADRRLRAAVAALPDGVYSGEELTDGDCFAEGEHLVKVTVEVAGDELCVDFTGSADQLRGFKNSSLANTYSAVYMALLSFFDLDLPRNEGAFRCVAIEAPEGTLVNPRYPAPVTMCTVFVAHEIVHAIWRALAQTDPGRACAGWGKPIVSVTTGVGDRGEPFVLYHWNALSGAGAVAGRDGFGQIGHLITLGGLNLPDLEVLEQLYPVRFGRQEFRCDSGGAGEFRGGSGVHYEVWIEVPATYSFRAEGLARPSGFGARNGETGAVGEMVLELADGEVIAAPRYGLRSWGPLRLEAASPGGGGWGDPLDRDPERVRRDVEDEVVGRAAAKEVYGVVLDARGEVDPVATEKLRVGLRTDREGADTPDRPRGT